MLNNINSLRRFSAVCLVIFWVILYFANLGWKPGFIYNAHRFFEIFLLGILLAVGLAIPLRFQFGALWARLCLALLLVMVLVVWFAESHWLAVRELLQYIALFAAILVVAKSRHSIGALEFDRAAMMGITLFSFGCSLIVLEGLVLNLSIGELDHRVIFGAFVNVRIFAELQFLTLLILPGVFLSMESARWRRFVMLTAMLGWALLILTGTRSAMVAIPFSLIVVGLICQRGARAWLKRLAMQFFAGLLFFLALRVVIAWYSGAALWGASGTMSYARTTSSGRLEMWGEAALHFWEQPWLGNGPGSFACFTDGLPATPHNLFFQLLSEWGVVMTLLCFAMALLLFIALVRNLRKEGGESPLKISLFATLVTVVAASMMQGMITAPLQQMLVVLVFGWALHVFAPNKFLKLEHGGLRRYQARYALLLVPLMVVTVWGVKSDLVLQRELLVTEDGVINLSYGPRFWADGHDHCADWHWRYYGQL